MRFFIYGCIFLLFSYSGEPAGRGPGSVKWMVPTDRIGWCSPAIGPDGVVYIGDNQGYLYAIRDLDTTWEFIWEPRKIDTDLGESSPTLTRNGKRLYIGTNTRPASMYCVNTEDGSVLWKYTLPPNETLYGGGLISSAALSHDEKTLYFGSGPWDSDLEVGPTTWLDDRFFALEDRGDSCHLKWIFKPEDPTDAVRFSFFGNPAVDADGSIYIGTFGGYLYKFRDSGDHCEVLWKHAFKRRVNTSPTEYQEVWGSPTLGPDGTVYITTNDWRLHAFTTDGKKKWQFETGGETWTTPVIANNGLLIFGSEDRHVYGIRDEGTRAEEVWRFPEKSDGTWWGTAAVAEDGTVVFGSEATMTSETGIYYAIDENDGSFKWKTPSIGMEARTHPAIGDDGTIFVSGGEGKNFYAIRGTAPLAKSFWPKMQQNNLNSGRIEPVAPPMKWHKGYGTDLGEHVHEGMQTSDGGYIGIGQTDEAKERGFDILVVKTDAEGELEWQRIIGNSGKSEVGLCVDEVEDGFLIGGGLWSEGSQKRYLSKLARNGETLWEQFYDGPGHDAIRSIDINDDGSLITTGYKGAPTGGFIFISEESEGFIMKTDQNGNPVWDKKISPPQGTKVRVDHGRKGYVIASTIWINGEHQDVQLLKYDDKGTEYWSNHYGGDEWDQCYDFDLTRDGGYICGGHSRSYGVNWDFYLLKIDSEGKEQWHNTFGQPRGYDARWIHDEAYGVRQTPDGGYVIVGGTGDEYPYSETGSPRGPSDIWQVYLVKTDADGHKLWEGVYGSPEAHDAGEYLGLTKDGGFIIFVDADSAGDMEPNNFGFMKIGGTQD